MANGIRQITMVRDGDLGGIANPRWWEEEDPSNSILQLAQAIEAQQGDRRWRDLIHASLYANQPLDSLYQLGTAKNPGGWWDPWGLGQRLTWNVVQILIDTAAAKISKNKPRVLFLTDDGNWSLQRRAKGLTRFLDGLFDAANVYEEAQRAFVDACVFDAGILKVYAEDDEIKVERVLPAELLIDDMEAVYETPRTLYQHKLMHRDVLLEKYGDDPKKRSAILAERGADFQNRWGALNMISAYEAWHLGTGDKPGRHAIVVGGATLFAEPWTKPYFPFAWFRWNRRLVGIWGKGLAEDLAGLQLEITKLLQRIQQAQHLMAVPRIYHERSSELPRVIFKNEIGHFVSYTGREPVERVAQAMSPEVYQHLERLYQRAFEVARISQLSAVGQKPSGLDAAVALREFHDIESEGFVVTAQRYEKMFIDLAKIMIDMATDLYKNRSKRINAPGTKMLETIDWRDVNMKEDQYTMRAFPVSLLPTTPAGRLQKVQELLQAGFIDKDMALSLLDFPDLESAVSLQTAALDDAKMLIERIVDHGDYTAPEPEQNLPLIVKLAQSAYLRGKTTGVPEAHLGLLQQLMFEAKAMQQDLAAPPGAPAPEGAVPEAPAAPGLEAAPPAPEALLPPGVAGVPEAGAELPPPGEILGGPEAQLPPAV